MTRTPLEKAAVAWASQWSEYCQPSAPKDVALCRAVARYLEREERDAELSRRAIQAQEYLNSRKGLSPFDKPKRKRARR
jgi:hypothetical protein